MKSPWINFSTGQLNLKAEPTIVNTSDESGET